jgi:hypothetical protein
MYLATCSMSVTLYANKHLLCARWRKITIEDLDALLMRAQSIERSAGRRPSTENSLVERPGHSW